VAKITFSTTRTFTFGEIELAHKSAQGDISAAIDLMVSRSDPKVTREQVCALEEGEILETFKALTDTVNTMVNMRKLFGDG
jgi:hypothetical protein